MNTTTFDDFINHPLEVADKVRKGGVPVILTESLGDLVLMSRTEYERYEDSKQLSELYTTLQARAEEASMRKDRISHDDVMSNARAIVRARLYKTATR